MKHGEYVVVTLTPPNLAKSCHVSRDDMPFAALCGATGYRFVTEPGCGLAMCPTCARKWSEENKK